MVAIFVDAKVVILAIYENNKKANQDAVILEAIHAATVTDDVILSTEDLHHIAGAAVEEDAAADIIIQDLIAIERVQ